MVTADGKEDRSGLVLRLDLDLKSPGDQQYIRVSPGENVTGYIEYQMWSGSNNPSEIGQLILIYSWAAPQDYYTCVYSGGVGLYPGIERGDYFTFTAPERPGTYYLWAHKGAHYSCELDVQGVVHPSPNLAVGMIEVVPSQETTPQPAQPPACSSSQIELILLVLSVVIDLIIVVLLMYIIIIVK